MAVTYTRLLEVLDASFPKKPRALMSKAMGGKPQVRDIARTKRSWTESYKSDFSGAAINTWVAQLYTWMNTAVELTNTHPWTGEAINCFIEDIRQPKVYGMKVVIGLEVDFTES